MALATRSTILGTAACAALAVGMLAGGGAGAATAATVVPGTVGSGVLQQSVARGSTASTSTYWTPARMQAAKSNAFVDPDPADGDGPGAAPDSAVASRAGSAVTAPTGIPGFDESQPVPGFAPQDHLGVVFFRSGGVDQRCTGNVVASVSGDLVATAGRCVSALAGQFVSQLAFVPQYDGTAPHGVWGAVAVSAPARWVTGREVAFDSAFFQVKAPAGAAAGATLSSTVGASGVSFTGAKDDDDFRSTGYPLDGGHDGTKAVSVESGAEPNPWMNRDDAIEGLQIESRAGISGSPWVSTDDAPVRDVQRGMTSFAYQHFTHSAFGPQWKADLHATYLAAAAAS
ncbi:hypothetical protein [Clavibacter sp. Sh2036]